MVAISFRETAFVRPFHALPAACRCTIRFKRPSRLDTWLTNLLPNTATLRPRISRTTRPTRTCWGPIRNRNRNPSLGSMFLTKLSLDPPAGPVWIHGNQHDRRSETAPLTSAVLKARRVRAPGVPQTAHCQIASRSGFDPRLLR